MGAVSARTVSWARTEESECGIGEDGGLFRKERINYLGECDCQGIPQEIL